MPLDTTKLVNLKSGHGKATAQCPACAAAGSDLHGKSHLVIFNSGAYGCAVDSSPEHRKTIWKLVGLGVSENSDFMYTPTDELPPEIPETWPVSALDRLVKDHSYWQGRGISPEIMEEFRGGVATKGYFNGRYVIPIFNPEQTLIIGFTGRIIKKEGLTEWEKKTRWKHKGVKADWIWGGLDDIESSRRAILVESPGDLLALRQHGIRDVLCIFGTAMSQAVLGQLITLNPSQIIISTNMDEGKIIGGVKRYPGQESAEKIRKALTPFFDPDIIVTRHPDAGTKDWGEATAEQIKLAFAPEKESPAYESTQTETNIDPDPDTLSFT